MSRFPAPVDLRWVDGSLEFWIRSCGPNFQDCGTGHQVVSRGAAEPISKVRLGSISVPRVIGGEVTVDNVLCLAGPAPEVGG